MSLSVSFSPSHLLFGINLDPWDCQRCDTWQWHIDYYISSSKVKTGIWLHLSATSTFECYSWKKKLVCTTALRLKTETTDLGSHPLIKGTFFFFSLSLFSCFCSDFTLMCNVERRMEIKWGLRFGLTWATWNIHQIVAEQFRATLLNYAAEQSWWMLKNLESTGIILMLGRSSLCKWNSMDTDYQCILYVSKRFYW